MKRIAASILAADFGRLGAEVKAVEAAGADWIHVDVMDGHFVPNLTIGPPVVAAIRRATELPLDVHLMITNPDRYIADYAKAGATYISVHQETCPHLHAVVQDIRAHGCKPSVVLNPATPFHTLDDILPDIDMVLVMSVNPGFGGQSFISTALDKLALASRIKRERGLDFLIEVDGGVKTGNVGAVSAAGAEVFVIGTGIFQTASYQATIAEIRGAIG
ncbi:ribulose-phosphate 3-epimerase [bacterium]|nr:ribulose-phosphate 3-epimerase [bacterium]